MQGGFALMVDRPKVFTKQPAATTSDSEDEEESRVGEMPPSDESDA